MPLGIAQHHRPVDRRHLDLGAEHRLVERDRQVEPDIVALAPEEAVRLDRDGDDRIAIAAGPGWPWPARRILVPSSTPVGSLMSSVLPPASVTRCGFSGAASSNGTVSR